MKSFLGIEQAAVSGPLKQQSQEHRTEDFDMQSYPRDTVPFQ